VPLILHLPPELRRQLGDRRSVASLVGRVIEQQVRLVDLYPTILDLLGLPLEGPTHGHSLRPLLEGRKLAERPAFAENTNVPRFERKSLRTDRYKLVHSYPKKVSGTNAPRQVELYDLHADAGERRNLAEERIEVRRALEEELERILGGREPVVGDEAVPAELDPDLRRRLEALGYIDD
jgi:arylsulfatase A-like enzyme